MAIPPKSSIKEKIDTTVRETFGAAWDGLFNPHAEENLRRQFPSAYNNPQPKIGIPDLVKIKYDQAVHSAGRKVWKTTQQVAASGFGKGALIMAGVVLLGLAIAFGFGAYAGALTVPSVAGMVNATVGQGIGIGLSQAGNLLIHPIGWLLMAAGGAVGAVIDVRKHHNRMNAEIARTQAEQYARIRELKELQELGVAQTVAPSVATPAQTENMSFAAREAQRRAAEEQTNYRGV